MKFRIILFGLLSFVMVSCGGGDGKTEEVPAFAPKPQVKAADIEDPLSNKGIGPITSMKLGEVDAAMAAEGQELFKAKCSACHKADKKYIGPAMAGVTKRRSPEWIMNMILNPEEMVAKDPIAMALLAEYNSPMANQSLTEDESRKILEYFRGI